MRRRGLREEYSVLWLATSVLMFIVQCCIKNSHLTDQVKNLSQEFALMKYEIDQLSNRFPVKQTGP